MSVIGSPPGSPAPAQTPQMTAGPSSGAKNSNHWSVEAREDMFSRRASGEGWETICKDYPTRTRHAMQQQYSMMKKQKDMDNGTFVPRQRGRKSKVAPRRSWTSVNKHHAISEDEEELELEDEDEDDVNEDESAANEDDERMSQNYQSRPKGARGEPLRLSIKSTLFPNLLASGRSRDVAPLPQADSEASNKSSAEREGNESEFRSSPHPNKRRKYSTEPSEISEYLIHPQRLPDGPNYRKTQANSVSTTELIWGPEDVAALQGLITKTREKSRSTSILLDAERESRQATYEAALGRANRRAHNADENLRNVAAEYGDKIRASQAALTRADQEANEIRKAHAETLAAQAAEIALLKSALEAASEQGKEASLADNVQSQLDQLQKQLDELQEKDSTKEEHLRLYDQLRNGITKEVDALQRLQGTTNQNSEALETAFETLSLSVTGLYNTVDDLSARKIEDYVRRIQDEKEEVEKTFQMARESWKRTSEAVAAFKAQFAAGVLDARGGGGAG